MTGRASSLGRRARAARALAAALVAVAAVRASAAELTITWDKDLAFEWDRANYERTLRELVARSDAAVAAWLGFARTGPVALHVLSRGRYEQTFGSGMAWNTGAFYRDGIVHVNGGARLDGRFAGVLAHELTHAYLDDLGTGHHLPRWLNEGLAERVGFRVRGEEGLTTGQVQELKIALQDRRLVPLSAATGRFLYLQGYAAVLFLEKKLGKDALLAVVRRTMRQGTFEQALDAELRWTPKDVDAGFATWVDTL